MWRMVSAQGPERTAHAGHASVLRVARGGAVGRGTEADGGRSRRGSCIIAGFSLHARRQMYAYASSYASGIVSYGTGVGVACVVACAVPCGAVGRAVRSPCYDVRRLSPLVSVDD